MAPKQKEKPGSRTFLIVFFCLSAVITLVAIMFPYIAAITNVQPQTVSVPPVVSSVKSSKDGKSHSVYMEFSLELTEEAKAKVNPKSVQGQTTEIVSGMDFDKMTGEDSEAYLKDGIAAGLSRYLEPGELKGVYLTDFKTDDAISPEELNPTPESTRDERLKGLFQNME